MFHSMRFLFSAIVIVSAIGASPALTKPLSDSSAAVSEVDTVGLYARPEWMNVRSLGACA